MSTPERVVQGLIDKILDLEEITGSNARFKTVKEEDTSLLIQQQKNTESKTKSDVNLFKTWMQCTEGDERLPEQIPLAQLDSLLGKFYLGVRNSDGTDYEPDSLTSFQNSMDRYLSEKQYGCVIKKDNAFEHCRQVLAAKRKALKKDGRGNKPQKAQALHPEDIETLYENGVLGASSANSLRYTVWWNNGLHFGLRGRQDPTNMMWGDVELKTTTDGKEYLEFTERDTKTRSGATRGDVRAVSPKMFADVGNPRCPVEMFYLRSLEKPNGNVWYSRQPVGKDTLGKYMKTMAGEGNLQGRLVNHSTRKTFATTLREAGVSPNEIAQLGGWKNVQSVNEYSVPSVKTQETASNVLASLSSSSSNQTVSERECEASLALSESEYSHVGLASKSSYATSASDSLSFLTNAHISGGVITINVTPHPQYTQSSHFVSKKRRVNVVYSDSEGSQ